MRCRNLVLCLILGVGTLSCKPGPTIGRYGAYPEVPGAIRLADGEEIEVYRLGIITFESGEPPALHLEVVSPVAVTDTATLRLLARRVWPAFGSYVEAEGLDAAYLTATTLQRQGSRWFGRWQLRHFGFRIGHDSAGVWRLHTDSTALPPIWRGAPPPRMPRATALAHPPDGRSRAAAT